MPAIPDASRGSDATRAADTADTPGVRLGQPLRISPVDAAAKVDTEQAIVVDVVSSNAWRRMGEAIRGAIRIPPEEFAQRWSELPREREIVAYCT